MKMRRSALIFHCSNQGRCRSNESNPDTRSNSLNSSSRRMILLGYLNGELTSIGGRKNRGETDLDCCCREVFEETKELVDYYPYKHGLNCGTIYNYQGCSYYIIEEEYDTLNTLCETFKETHSTVKEQNELSELILFDIDKLVEAMILNRVPCKEELKDFTLTILYHLIKPVVTQITCVERKGILVTDIQEEVELSVSFKDLPLTVDIVEETKLESFRNVPKIYGRFIKCNTSYYIVECLYDGCNLSRSGIHL